MTVKQLGFYDANVNGLSLAHNVYISPLGGGAAGQCGRPGRDRGSPVAGYRFVTLAAPLVLGPGTYTVWGDAYDVDANYNHGTGPARPTAGRLAKSRSSVPADTARRMPIRAPATQARPTVTAR